MLHAGFIDWFTEEMDLVFRLYRLIDREICHMLHVWISNEPLRKGTVSRDFLYQGAVLKVQ